MIRFLSWAFFHIAVKAVELQGTKNFIEKIKYLRKYHHIAFSWCDGITGRKKTTEVFSKKER